MAKPKKKLTTAQKREKAKYMTIFMNGKQKRVLRPVLIDGLSPEEFFLRNADPITLHQHGLWEYMPEYSLAERDATGADDDDIPF